MSCFKLNNGYELRTLNSHQACVAFASEPRPFLILEMNYTSLGKFIGYAYVYIHIRRYMYIPCCHGNDIFYKYVVKLNSIKTYKTWPIGVYVSPTPAYVRKFICDNNTFVSLKPPSLGKIKSSQASRGGTTW